MKQPSSSETLIAEANQRLKAGRIGVKIEMRAGRDRLNLVATLPPKPDSNKTQPHQQRISLGIFANPAGIKRAEAEAQRLGSLIAMKQFNWQDYCKDEKPKQKIESMAERIAEFKVAFFKARGNNIKVQATWQKDYWAVLRQLPDKKLTASLILETIEATTQNTRTRKKTVTVLRAFALHQNISVDLTDLSGNYSPKSVQRRNLPTDDEIERVYNLIPTDSWKWVYGMLATYGLRPHEVFYVDHDLLIKTGICYVKEGKTSDGRVWPLYPHWVALFKLKEINVPKVTGHLHIHFGQRVSGTFWRYKLPLHAYDLRHCWARRAIDLGLDSRLAAQQMRHEHQVHTQTYNQWLGEASHQKAFDEIVKRLNKKEEE